SVVPAGVKENPYSKPARPSFSERNTFALNELRTILKRIWKWVLIGVGLGALFHGFVPESFILDYLGAGRLWTVPAAVGIGIPLYSNASGIIPIAESLLQKGLPVGTTLAFMMSTVAASLPEFMMLKQVMKIKLLIIFFSMLLFFFTLIGWIFNLFIII
ncbi:permease, partial [bacterium]|nr:permease [bacterium]